MIVIMRYYSLLLTVSVLTRLPSLFVRVIDADEAVYANTARGILKGLVLYRDVIDQKPPLIYYLYALFFGMINDLRFVHAISILVVWLTAIVVYRLVARCFDRHSGAVAGILYAAFVSTVGYASNAEIFMNLPLVLGIWLFFAKPQRVYMLVFAGIFVGIASLIKQQAFVAMLPLCLMIVVTRFRLVIASEARRSRCKTVKRDCFGAKAPRNDNVVVGLCELGALLAGAAMPFALVLFYFWKLDTVHDFIRWSYVYNMRYIAPESGLVVVIGKAALVAVLPTLILWWYALKRVGELRAGGQERDRGAIVFGLLWLGASVYAVALGQRFYTHYFVQLIPPLVFLAAQPIAERLSNLRKMHVLRRIVFLWFLITPAIIVTVSFGIKAARGGFDCQKPSIVWASEFVDAQTKPDDRVFVWGDSLIEYLADRPSASRFMNSAFVLENRDPCYRAEGIDVSKFAATQEFGMLMNDLMRQPPILIVDTSSSDIHCWQKYPVEKFAPLANFIHELYENVGEFGRVRIWSKKQ